MRPSRVRISTSNARNPTNSGQLRQAAGEVTIRTDLYDTFLVGAPFLPIDRVEAHARQWPHARPFIFEQVVHAFISPVMLVVAEFVTPRQQMLA